MTDDNLQLILQNALRLHKTGQLDQAESCYKQILEQEPSAPNTLHYLSLLKGQQKNYVEAADYAARAIGLVPDNAHYHFTLANALKEQGKPDEAIAHYQKALALQPEYAEAAYELGGALLAQEKLEEAVTAFKQALAVKPDLVEAYAGLGVVRNKQQEYQKAITALKEAEALRANDMLIHYELAKAYMGLRIFNMASESLKKVLALSPNDRETLYMYAEICYEMRNFSEAISTIKQLIALGPDPDNALANQNYSNAFVNLGIYLQVIGDFDGAETAFLKALSLNDGNIAAFYGLDEINRFPADFHEADKIRALLQQPERYSKLQIAFLHITLSRILEKQKQDEEAFEHLQIGKKIKYEQKPWNMEPTRHAFSELIRFFTPEFMNAHKGVGNPSNAPIFVISMPRSGSTLTEQILASHSQVFGAGELGAINGAVSNLIGVNNLDFPYVLDVLKAEQFNEMGTHYLKYVESIAPSELKYFTDKLPANFRLIGFINLILPNAKFVHCLRHPVDTCLGCFKQMFRDENLEYTSRLEDIGHYYRLYDQLMNHWKKLLPGKILDVYYEQVVADQEAQSRRLLDFCGLPWEDGVLEYYKTERPVFTASSTQVRKPIYSSALGRWKRYEKHLGPLLDILGPVATDYPY